MKNNLINLNNFTQELSVYKHQYQKQIEKVLKSGWFILGKELEKFEKEYAKYLEVKYAVGVGNGLEAIQISLMALRIGPGDEVMTTPVSAVATTLAILAVGAKPVFVDTDENGLIDADLIESSITKKTKVILPVHLYGQAVNLEKLIKICKEYNLFLVEDTAQAHGSFFKGKKLGTFGKINAFSFYPTKNLGAFGDGGAVVTNSGNLAKICRQIRDYGQEEKYIHKRYGLNSRLDELQAAILQVKLKNLDENNKKRRILAGRYIKNLSKLNIRVIGGENIQENNFHLLVIMVKNRDKLGNFLRENGIESAIHYPLVIPDQPFLKEKFAKLLLPKSREFVRRILSLPMNPYLSLKEVDFICKKISEFYKI